MVNYQKERVKLTNTQLKKQKSASKNKKEATLKLNMKKFEDEEFTHELFVITRKSITIYNTIVNNTSKDVKLSKDQILKFSQGSATIV